MNVVPIIDFAEPIREQAELEARREAPRERVRRQRLAAFTVLALVGTALILWQVTATAPLPLVVLAGIGFVLPLVNELMVSHG